ncbi:MAG TPA: porin family protein [Flavisolibacter sp.]|nr:porin family protein [Flavisolibacter sp.]
MKKIGITTLVLSALVLSASAQQRTVSMTRNNGTTIGIHGGVNFFNINGKTADGVELNNKLKTGFTAGADVQLPLGGGSYLAPGVSFIQKGTETENGIKTTLNYVEVPVNFLYKPIVGTGNLVLGFGPYIGLGVGGKVTNADGSTADVVFDKHYDRTLPASTVQLRKTDAGANFIAGYEFANKLSLNLKAQLGLKDINPDMGSTNSNDQTRYRNTGFGASLGYRF